MIANLTNQKSMKNQIHLLIITFIIFSIGCAGRAFENAQKINTVKAYDKFLNDYGDSDYAQKAKLLREKSCYNSSINGDINSCYFYLKEYPEGKYAIKVKTVREKKYFLNSKNRNSIESYENYLSEYANGTYFNEAKEARENLWFEKAKKINTTDSYRNYIKEFPQGRYKEEANQLIIELVEEKLKQHDVNKVMYTKDSQKIEIKDIEGSIAISEHSRYQLSDLQKVAFKANGFFEIDTSKKNYLKEIKEIKIINSLIFQDQPENIQPVDFEIIPEMCRELDLYGIQWRLPTLNEYKIFGKFNKFKHKYYFEYKTYYTNYGYTDYYLTSTLVKLNNGENVNEILNFRSTGGLDVRWSASNSKYLYRCVADIPTELDLANGIFMSKLYPKLLLPEKPIKSNYFKYEVPIRKEFEVKVDFNKRKKKEQEIINKKNLQIDSDFKKTLHSWSKNVESKRIMHKNLLEKLQKKKNKLMLESIKLSKIINMHNLLNKGLIKICTADYDIDNKILDISICGLPETIELKIPLNRNDAIKFKNSWLNRLVFHPILKYHVLNGKAKIVGVKQIQDPKYLDVEDKFKNAYNSIEELQKLVAKHSDFIKINDAKARLSQLKIEKQEKQKAEKQKIELLSDEYERYIKYTINDILKINQKKTIKLLFTTKTNDAYKYIDQVKSAMRVTDSNGIFNIYLIKDFLGCGAKGKKGVIIAYWYAANGFEGWNNWCVFLNNRLKKIGVIDSVSVSTLFSNKSHNSSNISISSKFNASDIKMLCSGYKNSESCHNIEVSDLKNMCYAIKNKKEFRCHNINDSDLKNVCYGYRKEDFCHNVTDNDLKNLCYAYRKKDFCHNIVDSDLKKLCYGYHNSDACFNIGQ